MEFATASVSSPGLEEYLALNTQDAQTVAQIEQVIALLVDDLAYNNLVERGYLTVTFTPAKASAKWNYISTIKAREYQVVESRTKELSMLAGQAQLQNA